MKKLLAKIRKILHDRRTRRFLTRFVSGIAAIVVFITTYALVLPAITMEKEANCGIEAHQHDDSCYTEELICDIPESEGHHHDESCYRTKLNLICETAEHEHSVENGCYDDEGNLICESIEHRHGDECYEEVKELTCEIPESDGHQHSEKCYEKVLTCGREVHVHSISCYEEEPVSDTAVAASTNSAAAATISAGSVSSTGMTLLFEDKADLAADNPAPVDNADTPDNDTVIDNDDTADNGGTGATASSTTADQYIPTLDAIDFSAVLNNHTGIYYHSVADGETVEDSSVIPAEEWNRIPNNTDHMDDMDDIELGTNDLLRVYLSYTIPAGSLNTTNPTARYRLPSNLHLTDRQVKAINENANGIAGQYIDMSTLEIKDPDKYNASLGLEAVEGTRRPDESVEDYLIDQAKKTGTDAADATEYISAIVRVENVYDTDGVYGDKGAYLGQDLIFTFTPYSIEKNQHEYDSDGQPTKAGEKIKGWLALDFNMGQVDFDNNAVDKEDSLTEKSDEEAGNTQNQIVTIKHTKRTAEIVFVEEGMDEKDNKIDQISTSLTMAEETVANVQDGEALEDVEKVSEPADQIIMPAMSFNDSIKVSTGRPAGIDKDAEGTLAEAAESLPEEAKVSVRVEADEGTFPAGTTMVLNAVDQSSIDALAETLAETVEKEDSSDTDTSGSKADDEKEESDNTEGKEKNQKEGQKNPNTKTYGFQAVDITFLDKDGNEIEPAKPVRVALTSALVEQAREKVEDSAIAAPVVVHVDNDGNAEQMDLVSPEEVEPAKGRNEEELIEEAEKTPEADSTDKAAPADDSTTKKDEEHQADANIATDSVSTDKSSDDVDNTNIDNGDGSSDVTSNDSVGNNGADVVEESISTGGKDTNAPEEPAITGGIVQTDATYDKDIDDGGTAKFSTDSFSVYAIVYTVELYTTVITDSGETYQITVTYDETSGIPQNAELKVKEIKEGDNGYENYYTEAVKAASGSAESLNDINRNGSDVGEPETNASMHKKGSVDENVVDETDKPMAADKAYARFFDIEIWADGQKVEPAGDVSVSIRLLDVPETDDRNVIKIVHFKKDDIEIIPCTASKDDAENTDITENQDNNQDKNDINSAMEFNFTANSFSVYSVVSYTVDFYWEVNGKLYEFSLPGGGFVSLQQLVEVLGIAKTPDINKKSDGLQATDDTEETESNNSADNNIGTENGEEISSIDDGTVENKPLTLNDVVVSDETRKFVADVETVKFSAPNLVWVGKAVEASTVSGLKEANELEVQYSMELTEDQIKKINDTEVESGDWALISMLPFESEESLTVSMKTGEMFTIKVTDATSDAIKKLDGSVDTIPNPSGTTIDLFDYWIRDDLKDNKARTAWPDTPGTVSTGNNLGINKEHMLKFSPANGGSVTDGTLGNGNQASADGGQGLNSWTTNASPRPGIVENKLVGGYPKLTNNGINTFPVTTNIGKWNEHTYTNQLLGTDGESLAYLFDNSSHDGKQTYFGVNHLLYVDPNGFYTYESNDFKADYNFGSKTFKLTDQTEDFGDARGFWPFGQQKYWVGMHMNTQFSMPADGRVLGPKGKYNDMQFEFKGDDDTWVYVDGVLVGDGGGIHNQTKIEINFRNGTARVTGKEDPKDDYYSDYDHTLYLDGLYKAAGRYNDFEWEPSPANNGHETFKAGTYHTFDMFYLERGGGESNLYIHYNLISTADFTAHKSYHSEGNHRLLRDQFQFELIGLDGQYRGEQGSRELIDPEKQAIMPKGGSSAGTGLVGDPYKNHSNGQTIYKVGVSEDGNINFGDADISSEEMRNCDNGSPSTYRYMVREIVPPDAVNADGKIWAQATEEERAEGGFHKVDENGEDITYDGKVYYFEGTVRRNLLSDGSYKYDLKKTRYTDATFTTEDTETKFFSFVNGHIDPLTLKVNKKSHTNKSLVGAEFKLTRAKKSDGKWMVREGSSTQTVRSNNQGEVIFNNPALTEGHYLLEETSAPAGYLQSDNLWLVTVNKLDSDTKIVLSPTITLLSSDGTPIGDPEPITVDNTTFTFEKTIVNNPIPKGDITVVKKWVKPNGVEYTQEEMTSLNTTGTRITGELWRKGQGLTTTQVKNPTVTIYGKKWGQYYSGKGDVLLSTQPVTPGSAIRFWVYRDYANNISVEVNNGKTAAFIERPSDGSGSAPGWRYIYEVADIKQDTEVTVIIDGNNNINNNIRYGTVSYSPSQEYSTQQVTGEIDEKVADFTLTGNTWSKTWTRNELNESTDDSFTYYLKNVVEQNPNGFTFLKDETGILDPATGTITFIQKNTNEKTQVKVKKEWVPEPETPSEASAQMILHRYRMLTKGVIEVTLVSDQGAAIQGAEFDLYKDNEIIGTYSTDVSGKIIVPDLTEGSYYLQQRTTPEPYRMEGTVKTEVWPVSGDSFDQQEHKETLVNYTKEPAGLFTILLTDPEGNGLENGIFDLYEQGQATPILTGITTDENGRWTTDRLGQGTYYFVQTGAPEGYVLPDQTQTDSFSVNDPNQVLEKIVTIVNNHKAKGRVTVTLTKDDENGQPIAGAEFELYFNGILLKSGITDENGIVSFTDLGAGSYQVKQRTSASGMNIAPFNEELHSFTIVEDGTTNQDKTMSFVNTASAGNVVLNIFSARSGSQYNAYPVDTFTGLKANTTYRIRIGVPASNVENGDQVSVCRLYEPGKVPQGEEPIDNSLWQYGLPEYVLYNGSNVKMKYYSIEFKPESDGMEYNYSIDSMQGWGLYPVTADTPVAVRRAASPLSSGRNLLRKNSIPASGAKGNPSRSSSGAANDAQNEVPAGYKDDTGFSEEYTITSSDSNWEHVFENLDKYDANGNPYIYYVVEGERTPQEYWVSSYEPNADGSVITVKNISTIELTIKKIDQTDMETVKNNQSLGGVSLLEGAKFKLLKYSSITPNKIKDTNWNQQHSNETSGTDGTFTFSDIGPGIYEIVETAYPTGYIRPTMTPFLQVASNLTVHLLKEDGTVLNTAESYYIFDETTIVVGNPPGAALPNTGGIGTRLFVILGSLLFTLATILLIHRQSSIG